MEFLVKIILLSWLFMQKIYSQIDRKWYRKHRENKLVVIIIVFFVVILLFCIGKLYKENSAIMLVFYGVYAMAIGYPNICMIKEKSCI